MSNSAKNRSNAAASSDSASGSKESQVRGISSGRRRRLSVGGHDVKESESSEVNVICNARSISPASERLHDQKIRLRVEAKIISTRKQSLAKRSCLNYFTCEQLTT